MHVCMYFLHLVPTFPPITSQWKRVNYASWNPTMLFLSLPAYYAKRICSILCVSLLAGAVRRGTGLPRGVRRRPPQDDPRHGAPGHTDQRLQGQSGGHDGRLGLHQDLHWEGSRQRHLSRRFCDGAGNPRLLPENRVQFAMIYIVEYVYMANVRGNLHCRAIRDYYQRTWYSLQ